MERKILDTDALSEALKSLDGWTTDGKVLKKSLKFENFADALAFVNQVGVLAESADHHPDVRLGWGYAELDLTTHDRGGVTGVDLALAAKIDKLEA
jgi:4a-hydroxytetrahydrobiopterin dehydratase